MKKILAMTAVAAFALGASSAVNGDELLNGTTFVDLTVGEKLNIDYDDAGLTLGERYWSVDDTSKDLDCVITNGVIQLPSGVERPAQWQNTDDGETSKYLLVEAERDNRLYRNINSASDSNVPQPIGEGLYFDSLVQFTATDTLPEVSTGDKLVVWLYGGEADSNDVLGLGEEGKVSTNLVVTAGYVNGDATTPTNYVVTLPAGVTVGPNSWHRLTIKAIANITTFGASVSESAVGGFVIYIDGQAVTSDETKGDFTNLGGLTTDATNLGNKLFPSLVEAGAAAATLTSVAFEGTGAIDDLVFTTTDPFPEAAAETFTLTATAPNGTFGLYSDYDCQIPITGSSPWTLAVPTETPAKIYASFTPDTGYNFVSATLGNAVLTPEEDGGTYYFELDISGVQADSTLALVITTTNGEVVPTFALTLTQGTGTTLSAVVDAQPAGATVESNKTVTITATISDSTAYENLVLEVGGVDVTDQLVNGQYSFTMTAATTVATSATAKQQPSSDYKVVIAGSDVTLNLTSADITALEAAGLTTVTEVNEFLAGDFNSTTKNWEVLFLGLNPQDSDALDDFKVASIAIVDGKVVVTMADGITLQTGRGVDITLNVYGSDDLVNWGSTPLATATNETTISAITPGLGETKKFYKVEVEFSATTP